MIKYYRKKGTDKATHKAEIRYESGHIAQDGLGQHIGFISLGTNIICDVFRGEAAFNQFLEENDFEEVMEWHKALEELIKELAVKDCYANNPKRAEDIEICADDLINAIEEEKQSEAKKEIKVNFHEKPMCKKHLKYLLNDKLGCEDCGKEEIKLPEVGKRYIQRITKNNPEKYQYIFWIKKIILNAYYFDGNQQTMVWPFDDAFCSQKFWEIYEELPEDNIEPTKEDLQIKSIWKDVSELPKENCEVIFKWYDKNKSNMFGRFNNKKFYFIPQGDNQSQGLVKCNFSAYTKKFLKYCELTDYINNTEERLKKLEGK